MSPLTRLYTALLFTVLLSASLGSSTIAQTDSAGTPPMGSSSPSSSVGGADAQSSEGGTGIGNGKHYIYEGRSIDENEYQGILKTNDATRDIQAQQWKSAETKLRAALNLAPGLYEAHSNLSLVLARLGHLPEAKTEAEIAVRLGPDKPEPLVAEAAVNQELGKLDEAATEYELFLRKFPNHPLVAFVTPLVADLRREASKLQAVKKSQTKSDRDQNDYFSYATEEAVTRWLPKRMPIKVYVPKDEQAGKVQGYKAEYGDALRASFEEWQTRTNGTVAFKYVPSSDQADIKCDWTDDVHKVRQPAEGGEAQVLYDRVNGINNVKIILLTTHIDNSLPPTTNLIRAVTQHEVGHALGLLGHSPNPSDVMFCSMPADDAPRPISDQDIKTLLHLYRQDIAITDGTKTEAGSPRVSLNDEGIAFADAHEFTKAAEKFEEALKLDPHFEACRRNLAACLNNIGIDSAHKGDFQQARETFQKALDLVGDQGDVHQRLAMLENMAVACDKLGKADEAQAARARAKQLTGAKP